MRRREFRFLAYAGGALLLYLLLIVVVAMVAIAIFGAAATRSGWFGLLFLSWFVLGPVVATLARRIALDHSAAKGEE